MKQTKNEQITEAILDWLYTDYRFFQVWWENDSTNHDKITKDLIEILNNMDETNEN